MKSKSIVISAIVLSGSLFFAGCKEKPKGSEETLSANINAADSTKESNTLLGSWISASYQKAVLENRSPYRSIPQLGEISELEVDGNEVSLVYNNSEGEVFAYEEVKGQQYSLKLGNGLQLVYNGSDKATIEGNKINESFVRSEAPAGHWSVVEQFIMSRLLAGSYNSAIGKVEINHDGTLKGLNNYVSYKVFTSFDELSNFDLIEFRDRTGKGDYKAWEIKDDLLILYNIVPGSAYLFEKGEEFLRLQLVQAVS
ncbi:hypothetical protein GC194_05810 [bacterium]|nr:hypothetical protein [bacterium]